MNLDCDQRILLPAPPFHGFVIGSGRRQHNPLKDALPQMFINLLLDPAHRLLLSHQQLKLRKFKSAYSLPKDLVELLFFSHFLCLMGGGNGSSERNDLLGPSGKSLSAAKVMFRFCSESCVGVVRYSSAIKRTCTSSKHRIRILKEGNV